MDKNHRAVLAGEASEEWLLCLATAELNGLTGKQTVSNGTLSRIAAANSKVTASTLLAVRQH